MNVAHSPSLQHYFTEQLHWPVGRLSIEREPLKGGLEAQHVAVLTVRLADQPGSRRSLRVVEKRLRGRAAREAAVYEQLLPLVAGELAPRLLACERASDPSADQPCEPDVLLYIEAVRRERAWPWSDTAASEHLLAQVAGLHENARAHAESCPPWDYEQELVESARQTVFQLEQALEETGSPGRPVMLAGLRATHRLLDALPRLRAQLLGSSLGSTVLHGDLHSGNVLVRRRGGVRAPVLLDWGRARLGSPLEDVSSWLQSLRYWDAETMRRHDTLFAGYLAASGRSGKLSSEQREGYWLAAACNTLAGALAYHLWRARDAERPAERSAAMHAASDAVRVLRRGAAVWS